MSKLRDHKKLFVFGKRFAGFAGMLLILLCAFSCSNLMVNDGGSLVIAVPGARAATASSFTIELTGSNGATQNETVSGGSTVQFDDLAPGAYNIVVEGIDTNNKVVVGGAYNATVVAGETASATVPLKKGVSDFAGFEEAVAAGGIVNVLTSIDVEKTLSISNTVTIVPVYQDVTLKNTGSGNLFIIDNSSGNLTIGGGEYTITLDGNKVVQSIISISKSGGTATLTDNGIITNAAASGINITSGKFNMTGGTIMNNNTTSSMGGGAVSLQGGTFTMSGGILKDNKSSEFGGAISMSSGTCTITGGSITGNSAQKKGGGVSVGGGTFEFLGGNISNNSATQGSGVQIGSGTFKMGGSAIVALNNDVYLYNKTINITSSLTGATPVATITPETYNDGTAVLQAENGVNLANEVGKFKVTQKSDGTQWTIDPNTGNLVQ